MTDLLSHWGQGWYLTMLSSCLCVSGCFIIFLDDVYRLLLPSSFTRKHPFKIQENYTFLNGSLGFSAGCLLFTSLYRLLPEAFDYLLQSSEQEEGSKYTRKRLTQDLIFSYVCGILVCLSFNYLLHLMTSESVVHCSHGDKNEDSHSHNHHDLEAHNHSNNSTHSHSHSAEPHSEPHTTENSPLITPQGEQMKVKKSFLHLITGNLDTDIGECKGYSSAEACLYKSVQEDPHQSLHYCEVSSLDREPTEHSVLVHEEARGRAHSHGHGDVVSRPSSLFLASSHNAHKDDHHHHINTPLSRLLLIGIQTTLAITLHKFPEGFITYITSETNPELGVSIFLSLFFHNFAEGFSMCLPLYYSFSGGHFAKAKAVLISGLLGGLSQPLGALAGYFFIAFNSRDEAVDVNKLNFIFGVTMAVTSGFLSVISLSMFSTGVSFSTGSSNFVMTWCLVGMVVIGISTTFTV